MFSNSLTFSNFDDLHDFLFEDLSAIVVDFLYSAEKIDDKFEEILRLLIDDHFVEESMPAIFLYAYF